MKTVLTSSAFSHWIKVLSRVEPHEIKAASWSLSYYFSLLCSYYILRPIRDEMGIAGGVENLQWLFTGTFLAMLAVVPLFGWITSRFTRRKFLPYVYLFFIINLIIFFLLFKTSITHAVIARAFYIWVSVFNLFVVSVFWSFMADIYNNEQAKRLFGLIAAGGTCGALAGPFITTTLAGILGPTNLIILSAIFLSWSLVSINQLVKWEDKSRKDNSIGQKPSDIYLRGGIFEGIKLVFRSPYLIGICALMLLYTSLATFLYFQQAQIIRDSFSDSSTRTAVFAAMDLAVNSLTIIFQLFLTSRIVKKWGISWTLAIIPLLLVIGFMALGIAPVLTVLIVVQVLRRAGNYAIMRPAREMLYVVLSKEEKYKAKNFIDTAVYRGGDAVSAWIYTGFKSLGFNISTIAFIAVPLTVIWAWIGYTLGKKQQQLANNINT